jgi:acetyltransferase-like isoleucine patch superfamily enzyme
MAGDTSPAPASPAGALMLSHVSLSQTVSSAMPLATRTRNRAYGRLHSVLTQGRMTSDNARVPLDAWRRVGPMGKVSIASDAWVQRDALGVVEGCLSIGAGAQVARTERLHVGPQGSLAIGSRSIIEPGARLVVTGTLVIEDDVYVGRDAVIIAFERVTIGAGSLLGERVSIHDENHGGPHDRQAFRTAPVSIGAQVWLAAGVVVTSGAEIGAGTTVGANAVVTGRLPSRVTAVGIPARPLATPS